MMNRMSFSETIFLFFLALIIFGPKKLPEIARTVGKALNEFKRASNEFKAQIEQEISHLEVENRQTILPPSPIPDGATSRSLNPEPPATLAALTDEPIVSTTEPPGATEAVVSSASVSPENGSPASVTQADVSSPPVDSPVVDSPGAASNEVTAPTSQESHV